MEWRAYVTESAADAAEFACDLIRVGEGAATGIRGRRDLTPPQLATNLRTYAPTAGRLLPAARIRVLASPLWRPVGSAGVQGR